MVDAGGGSGEDAICHWHRRQCTSRGRLRPLCPVKVDRYSAGANAGNGRRHRHGGSARRRYPHRVMTSPDRISASPCRPTMTASSPGASGMVETSTDMLDRDRSEDWHRRPRINTRPALNVGSRRACRSAARRSTARSPRERHLFGIGRRYRRLHLKDPAGDGIENGAHAEIDPCCGGGASSRTEAARVHGVVFDTGHPNQPGAGGGTIRSGVDAPTSGQRRDDGVQATGLPAQELVSHVRRHLEMGIEADLVPAKRRASHNTAEGSLLHRAPDYRSVRHRRQDIEGCWCQPGIRGGFVGIDRGSGSDRGRWYFYKSSRLADGRRRRDRDADALLTQADCLGLIGDGDSVRHRHRRTAGPPAEAEAVGIALERGEYRGASAQRPAYSAEIVGRREIAHQAVGRRGEANTGSCEYRLCRRASPTTDAGRSSGRYCCCSSTARSRGRACRTSAGRAARMAAFASPCRHFLPE